MMTLLLLISSRTSRPPVILSTAEADRISEAAHFMPESLDTIPAGSVMRVNSSGKSLVSTMKNASEGTATHGSTTTTCLSFLMKKAATASIAANKPTSMIEVFLFKGFPVDIPFQKYKILICFD